MNFRLYRSLWDRYKATVIGGQCVANKYARSPFACTPKLSCLSGSSITIRWLWGHIFSVVVVVDHP